ncbi:MAG: hypothetical protein SOR87_05420 [Vescimonas coprocola]|nr:hypothetical protein [Vescimonas coprocola]
MITIHRADDVFSVDTEQTQRYDAAHSLCGCGYCRNYYAQIKGKLPKLDAFLREFGVDMAKLDEISSVETDGLYPCGLHRLQKRSSHGARYDPYRGCVAFRGCHHRRLCFPQRANRNILYDLRHGYRASVGVGRTVSEVDEEPIRENERNVNDLFIEYYLPPAARFLPIAAFFIGNVPPAAHFSQQLEKWAKAHTVVSADFQPRCGVKIGTLPRNHLASSATGGASAVSAKNQWFLDFLYLQEFRSI